MNLSRYKFLVYSDLYRIYGKFNLFIFILALIFNEGFKYCFWMRTCAYLHKKNILMLLLYYLVRIIIRHYTHKYGISIPFNTKIDSGFYIGHYGGIVVNYKTIIGKNCNISHGVTLGQSNRGKHKGCPIIGDNVYIAPGAKIIGNIKIGDNDYLCNQ